MSYEIENTVEFLRDCITDEWIHNEYGGGSFEPALTYEGKEVVRLLRRIHEIFEERQYDK